MESSHEKRGHDIIVSVDDKAEEHTNVGEVNVLGLCCAFLRPFTHERALHDEDLCFKKLRVSQDSVDRSVSRKCQLVDFLEIGDLIFAKEQKTEIREDRQINRYA